MVLNAKSSPKLYKQIVGQIKLNNGKLLPVTLPMVLDEILLKLPMGTNVLNTPVGLKKCLDTIWVS
jgi:hypothetical protein